MHAYTTQSSINYYDSRLSTFQIQDDLIKLIDELKDVTDWQRLGLQLTVRQSILEEVELNNRNYYK